jgi:hypothetical protein
LRRSGWKLAWVTVALAASCLSAAPSPAAPSAGSTAGRFQGWSLTDALLALESAGLRVVFSSQLVRPEMRVEQEPRAGAPREILDEILAPHGLRAVPSDGDRLVVVRAPAPRRALPRPDSAAAEAGAGARRFEEEILVTPERDAADASPAAHALSASDLADRPNVASDPLRALGGLPGAVIEEGSSRVQVRGGRDDDVLILLDGLELLAPYHLQEFDSALSIVSPTSLDRAELIPSGYPAEYGDRMGGVLDLVTASGRAGRSSLGLGLTHLDFNTSRSYSEGRGNWYVGGRGGSYELALEVGGRDANPQFWDLFGKVDHQFGPGHSLRLSSLFAEDSLSIETLSSQGEAYGGDWTSRYVWLMDQLLLTPDLEVETILSLGEIGRVRFAAVDSLDSAYTVRDRRSLRLAGAKQVWRFEPSRAWSLEGGAEIREMGATLDYDNDRRLGGPLSSLRTIGPTGATEFSGRFDYNQGNVFTTARARLGPLTGEIGVRYDADTSSRQEHVSPRSSVAWSFAPGLVARASWGWYYQTQRPNELQVEDEETRLQRAERAEHRDLQLDFSPSADTRFRIDLFQRRSSRSRTRFVNLFDATSFFPELEDDRIRVTPARGLAEGVEVGYQGRYERASWRLAYAYSTSEEWIGGRWVPSALDQRHALNVGGSYRWKRGWSFDLAWIYHSGWPTTAVALDAGSGSPTLGPLNGERLPEYHRLDLRVAKTWALARGALTAHIDLQNLYDRDNVRGRADFRLVPNESGGVRLDSRTTRWTGIFPSFGLRWSF